MDYKGVTIYQTPDEVENLRRLVREVKDIKGVLVEVGVYEGASAAIIREEDPRPLYLFDTFTGFPNSIHKSDIQSYKAGDCMASSEHVRKLMRKQKQVTIVEGVFPQTAGPIADMKIAFAHIDVDIYSSTKDALEFIKPRMTHGGIILIHDYPAHTGVKQAVADLGLEVEVLGGRQAIWKSKI